MLEHVNINIIPSYINDICRILKKGGYSVHRINLTDHLYAYDKSVSPKQYLKYPPAIWDLFFQNSVQYINRIPRSKWIDLFNKAGFELIEEEYENTDISGLRVAKQYLKFSEDDWKCTEQRLLHIKPLL